MTLPIDIDQALMGYALITVICSVPLRVLGETWFFALTRAAVIPAVVIGCWLMTTLILSL